MRRYLEARRRSLLNRPKLFREYISRLVRLLGGRASIIVFGGRSLAGIDSPEPRDYDILVVVPDDADVQRVEDEAYSVRPRGLPVDIVVVRVSDLSDPVVRQMLENSIIVHDPLGVGGLLETLGVNVKKTRIA